ncbi:MAG: hypothetical protein RBT42_12095 [Aquabacterium sp.]|nr:hypothetical protein [Aquabacterium sp.]
MTLHTWLQVTLMAAAGSCKPVGVANVVSHAVPAQQLGAFTTSWISHVDWPPSVAPSAPFRQG